MRHSSLPVFHLICVFTFYGDTLTGHAAVIADDTFYVLSQCAQYINVRNSLVIKFALTVFIYCLLLCIHNGSPPALHIGANYDCLERHKANILSTSWCLK